MIQLTYYYRSLEDKDKAISTTVVDCDALIAVDHRQLIIAGGPHSGVMFNVCDMVKVTTAYRTRRPQGSKPSNTSSI